VCESTTLSLHNDTEPFAHKLLANEEATVSSHELTASETKQSELMMYDGKDADRMHSVRGPETNSDD